MQHQVLPKTRPPPRKILFWLPKLSLPTLEAIGQTLPNPLRHEHAGKSCLHQNQRHPPFCQAGAKPLEMSKLRPPALRSPAPVPVLRCRPPHACLLKTGGLVKIAPVPRGNDPAPGRLDSAHQGKWMCPPGMEKNLAAARKKSMKSGHGRYVQNKIYVIEIINTAFLRGADPCQLCGWRFYPHPAATGRKSTRRRRAK